MYDTSFTVLSLINMRTLKSRCYRSALDALVSLHRLTLCWICQLCHAINLNIRLQPIASAAYVAETLECHKNISVWSSWTLVGECSRSCGTGNQLHRRKVSWVVP